MRCQFEVDFLDTLNHESEKFCSISAGAAIGNPSALLFLNKNSLQAKGSGGGGGGRR